MIIRAGEPLSEWTWWEIGGPADWFALPTTIDEVREALRFARERGLPVTPLGGGTNVLVSDSGVEGLVIAMRELRGVDVEERGGRLHMTALAGSPKAELTKQFLKRRLAPALFLCGLPGDVGGGVVMNAGIAEKTVPREFNEIVDWVEVLDGDDLRRLERDEITWTYRHTEGWQPGLIVRVGISWPLAPDAEIPQKVKDATRGRLAKQPLDLPSCGSTFKNPPGTSAGRVIEACGLKGYQVGGAQVSTKHANFIVNLGGATAADVRQVIDHVRAQVKSQHGLDLETEVKFLGRL